MGVIGVDLAPTLGARDHKGPGNFHDGALQATVIQPVVMAFAQNQRGELRTSEVAAQLTTGGGKPGEGYAAVICTTGDVTHALTHEGKSASEDGTGRGTPIVDRMVAFGEYTEDGMAGAIKARDYKDATDLVYAKQGRPRRLTPLECERLMSWPDHWTATGIKEDGTEYALSDTARYRLCGNGVGSVQVQWIATRLISALIALDSQQLHP